MINDIETEIKFVKREINTLRQHGDNFITEKRIIIGFTLGELIIPHPVTDFIDKKYFFQSGSINSEKAPADTLVQFLNFILKEKRNNNSDFWNVNGIVDLQLIHLEKYLEFCSEKGNTRGTVLRKENYLLQFYYFIGVEKKKLIIMPNITSTNDAKYKGRKVRFNKLFANLYYKKPSKDNIDRTIKKKDFVSQRWTNLKDKNEIRQQLIREFLFLASKNFPDIAFAICLQIFGGLRAAECMNLDINAIKPQNNSKYGERGLIVEIRDRQSSLFKPSNQQSNDQVKKARDQAILLDPLVPYLYKKHLHWLQIKRKDLQNDNTKLSNDIALFINSYGEPMKTHTYRSRFNNLKSLFLNLLSITEGRYEDFKEFRNTKWSTHICRGTFTNMCLDSGFNASQTAIMRGDNSPEAMFAYTDILTASKKITQAVNLILDDSILDLPELKDIDYIKSWNEVVLFANTNK